MTTRPTALELIDSRTLKIEWTDGQVRHYSVSELRASCPCASCREKRNAEPAPLTQLPILTAEEAKPTTIAAMQPMGSYAYSISYSDGHDTGIYTFEDLLALGQSASS